MKAHERRRIIPQTAQHKVLACYYLLYCQDWLVALPFHSKSAHGRACILTRTSSCMGGPLKVSGGGPGNQPTKQNTHAGPASVSHSTLYAGDATTRDLPRLVHLLSTAWGSPSREKLQTAARLIRQSHSPTCIVSFAFFFFFCFLGFVRLSSDIKFASSGVHGEFLPRPGDVEGIWLATITTSLTTLRSANLT